MQPITYHAPASVDEACELLSRHGDDARVLAGGQSLVQLLKQRLVSAQHVVDVGGIDGLDEVRLVDGSLRVGATATYAAVRRDETVREAVPAIPEMIATIGDRQVRARGTLVGGVAHADPDGDPPVLATALDATVRARSADGERTIPAPEFYEGLFQTALSPDELVAAVEFQVLGGDEVAVYRSFTPRMGDYAVASVALVAGVEDGDCLVDSRVVAGGVADTPLRLSAAEEALDGVPLDSGRLETVEAAARDAVDPLSDPEFSSEYRASLVGTLVSDAATAAVDR